MKSLRRTGHSALCLTALILGGFCLVPTAQAERITIQMRDTSNRPVNGTIKLVGKTKTRTCKAVAGRCTIQAPPGSYEIKAVPSRGGRPPKRALKLKKGGAPSIALKIPSSTAKKRKSTAATKKSAPAKLKNLGKGSSPRIDGQVRDGTNRPVNARLVWKLNGTKVGFSQTVAGRFVAYDLKPGSYKVTITPTRGKAVTRTVKVTSKKQSKFFKL